MAGKKKTSNKNITITKSSFTLSINNKKLSLSFEQLKQLQALLNVKLGCSTYSPFSYTIPVSSSATMATDNLTVGEGISTLDNSIMLTGDN